MKTYWKFRIKAAPVLRGITTSYVRVSAGYSAEREPGSHPRLKEMVRRHVEQKIRDNNFQCPQ